MVASTEGIIEQLGMVRRLPFGDPPVSVSDGRADEARQNGGKRDDTDIVLPL
jgi:hypothetical protein